MKDYFPSVTKLTKKHGVSKNAFACDVLCRKVKSHIHLLKIINGANNTTIRTAQEINSIAHSIMLRRRIPGGVYLVHSHSMNDITWYIGKAYRGGKLIYKTETCPSIKHVIKEIKAHPNYKK